MEEVNTAETSISLYETTRRNAPDDSVRVSTLC